MDKAEFTEKANERRQAAKRFFHTWRSSAIDWYAFISGDQWAEADKRKLESELRAAITFNYSEKMLDAVVGAELGNRQEVSYRPRAVQSSGLAELWNAAAAYVRDDCNAEDEETEAFRDALVCGLGWTQTRLTYDTNKDGDICIDRIDPLEMWYDPAAKKQGLADRRYHFREWWVDEEAVHKQWPNAEIIVYDDEAGDVVGTTITRGQRYREDDDEQDDEAMHEDQIRLCLYECVELEPFYRIDMKDHIEEMPQGKFNAIKPYLEQNNIRFIKQFKKVYYRAFFAGDSLLEVNQSPVQEGFSFHCITAKRNRNRNTWYGLTQVMMDPQRWANKWLSQILHIINANAKGGLLAETGAFVDPKRAEEEWAQPDSITMLNEGGLNKVLPKAPAPYPQGLDRLMEFALSSLPQVTGINLEALGLANREQANVLEASRKQAAYGLLSPLFNALRLYRKVQGRVLLAYIHQFITDGRLVRLGGPDSQNYVPLTKSPDAIEYDIIVDQSPTAPDVKQRTWETMMQLVPALLKAGIPLPPDLLDYAPLPTGMAAKWKEFIAKQPHIPPQLQQQMQQMQEQLQKVTQENAALKSDMSIEQAKLQQQGQAKQMELGIKAQSAQQELELKQQVAEAEFRLEVWKAQHQQASDATVATNDMMLKTQQVHVDGAIKAHQVMQDGALAQHKVQQDTAVAHEKVKQDTAVKHKAVSADATVKQRQLAADTQLAQQKEDKKPDNSTAKAITALVEALGKPRKLITDANGRPIGSKPVDNL